MGKINVTCNTLWGKALGKEGATTAEWVTKALWLAKAMLLKDLRHRQYWQPKTLV